jgi:hypothetical protein
LDCGMVISVASFGARKNPKRCRATALHNLGFGTNLNRSEQREQRRISTGGGRSCSRSSATAVR